MPTFSDHSRSELETLHPDLQAILNRAIDAYNFKVLEGHRGKERQNRLYRQDKSQLQYPESEHNKKPSRAVDVAPWPVDWEKRERFYHLAGHIEMIAHHLRENGAIDHRIRWGGDWDSDHAFDDNQFDDLPHFELA